MEFTALGDTVNIASRLEGVNKFYGTNICVSHAIFLQAHEQFEFRFLDTIRVKGRTKSLRIYELLSTKGSLTEKQTTIQTKFQIALEHYLSQDFQNAKLLFNELVNM